MHYFILILIGLYLYQTNSCNSNTTRSTGYVCCVIDANGSSCTAIYCTGGCGLPCCNPTIGPGPESLDKGKELFKNWTYGSGINNDTQTIDCSHLVHESFKAGGNDYPYRRAVPEQWPGDDTDPYFKKISPE